MWINKKCLIHPFSVIGSDVLLTVPPFLRSCWVSRSSLLWLQVHVKTQKGCCRARSRSHGAGCVLCNAVGLCAWWVLRENVVPTSPCHSRSSGMFCDHGNVEVIDTFPAHLFSIRGRTLRWMLLATPVSGICMQWKGSCVLALGGCSHRCAFSRALNTESFWTCLPSALRSQEEKGTVWPSLSGCVYIYNAGVHKKAFRSRTSSSIDVPSHEKLVFYMMSFQCPVFIEVLDSKNYKNWTLGRGNWFSTNPKCVQRGT